MRLHFTCEKKEAGERGRKRGNIDIVSRPCGYESPRRIFSQDENDEYNYDSAFDEDLPSNRMMFQVDTNDDDDSHYSDGDNDEMKSG